MSSEALRTEKVGRFTVEIHYDTDPMSPREWDNLGMIAAWHRRYNLGDKDGTRGLSPVEFKEWLDENPNVIALPVFMYDHSGICLSTGAFGCRWDSGQLGYIYATPEKLAKEYGDKQPDREEVLKVLKQEIETYSAFVEGRNYGYIVKGEDGETLDSCWGFTGDDDYALDEGKSNAQGYEDEAATADHVAATIKFPVGNWMIGANMSGDLGTEENTLAYINLAEAIKNQRDDLIAWVRVIAKLADDSPVAVQDIRGEAQALLTRVNAARKAAGEVNIIPWENKP